MTAPLLVLGEFRRDFPHKKLPRRVFPGILSVRRSIAHEPNKRSIASSSANPPDRSIARSAN
jgi:hypothetical protein